MTSHAFRSNTLTYSSSILGRTVLTVLASSLIGLTASQVHAGAPAHDADAPAISVSYSDLNLATEEGTLALYKRIVSAARQVCPADTGPSMRLIAQARHCVNGAVSRAVSDIQSPKLAMLQAARMARVDGG